MDSTFHPAAHHNRTLLVEHAFHPAFVGGLHAKYSRLHKIHQAASGRNTIAANWGSEKQLIGDVEVYRLM